ncbi:MAG: metallophosphatase family protein, partial [Desulfobacterales bacterium]|nr:metallophosphatase family protein [Desulfobacterales bacterium]
VHGNMDPVEVKAMLPEKRVMDLGGYRFGLIHGGGSSAGLEERVWRQFQDVDIIVYGHSHKAANHMRDGILLFNPGTATGFTSGETHSIGLLECGETAKGRIVAID